MNRDLDLLDLLNIMSFIIGLMNLDENMTQGDKQELLETLNRQTSDIITEINNHLVDQDKKLNQILEELK